jgi:hypothetical protein
VHANPKTSSADRTEYYVEFANARPLKIGDLGHFTAHIHYLRIIDERCLDISVPHQLHERGQAHAGADHVGGEAVPEAMWVGELDLGGLTMVAK